MATLRLAIYATVDEADLDAFDGDLTTSIGARLGEVFGDDGSLLTSVRVLNAETDGEF
jgi:hypothetical protein